MRMIRHDLQPKNRNIFTPASRTGSPSGSFVGTGVNRKSAARPEHSPSRSSASTDYTKQVQQFVGQSPEPFRNPAAGANPQRNASAVRLNDPYVTPAPSLRPGEWTRAQPQRQPHSQEEINTATGHARDYRPQGYTSITSGHPGAQGQSGEINLPGGPRAKRSPGDSGRPNPASWRTNPARAMRTNQDEGSPFNAREMAKYARREGGRGGVL